MPPSVSSLLKRTPYFAMLSAQDLAHIATLFAERGYDRGEYVFLEGDPVAWCGLIVEGQVKLVKHSDTGKDLTVDVLGPERFIGITTLFENSRGIASVQALEPTRLLCITRGDLVALLREFPPVCLALITDLGRRLDEAYEMMRSLALERVERRVALNLIKLASKAGVAGSGGTVLIGVPLTRQEIADLSGTTIETAIRTMSKFQKDGLIESEDGHVRLLKPHRLVLIAEDLE
jgi:CRP/FNR family transcriptional regulator, nitrogen oxide reductase regulator